MLFNIDKCKILHLGYSNSEVHYIMETAQLQSVSEERSRIIISADLKCKDIKLSSTADSWL